MTFEYNDEVYEVNIEKKKSNRNTYIRVNKDLVISVTTNYFTREKEIEKILAENYKSVCRMIDKAKKKIESNEGFNYLGVQYDIIYVDYCDISFGTKKVFLNKKLDIDKWYKKQAETLFKERLDYWYNNFTYKIPYPNLTIRKMTSRWGVCNSKLKRVTLNLELMKKEIACLDYVIVHELSHFIEMNHSNRFWKVVGENYPDYREIRRKMKNY